MLEILLQFEEVTSARLQGLDLTDPIRLGRTHLLQLVLNRGDQVQDLIRANS
ncbi:MAG: hypothetical protein VX641_02190 [Planctomycetota bacterium]|nr:hypothetical protein [Planctomycetota bacterium]